MLFLIKLLKKFLKVFNSNAAPWQIGLAAALGVLLGFIPLWPAGMGPSPLALCIIGVVLVCNCHLGTALMLSGLSAGLSYLLAIPALAIGNACSSVAESFATNSFLFASHLSHTAFLGLSIIGCIVAPIAAVVMIWATKAFREKLREKLLERKKLIKAGKLAGNGILLRIVCWFFDL